MPSIFAAATRCAPSSPKRETARGWSWLFQYRLFQPTSARPVLPAAERRLEVGQRAAAGAPTSSRPGRACTCSNWNTMSSSACAGSVNSRASSSVTRRHLADGEQLGVAAGEHLAVHLGQELVDARAAARVLQAAVARARRDRAVGQRRLLGDEVDDVHPEAVDAPVQPPAHHRVDGLAHLRVLPVQVGLLAREQVQVVLAGRRVELPRRAGEERAPVVRALAPPVPVALRVVADRARLHEPRVLVGRVVDDEVHDELHAARVHAGEQRVEVRQRPERRVDVLVVGDVVAVVVLRRGVDGREPDARRRRARRGGRAAP